MSSTPEIVTIPVPEKPLHKNEQLKSESHFFAATFCAISQIRRREALRKRAAS